MTTIIVEDQVRIRIAPGADLSADPVTWSWVDITGLWRKRERIVITTSRRDEGKSASPASCTITFDGRGGELWSRNPLGPWFGTLGVNTPLQVQWLDPVTDRFDGLISQLPPRRDRSGNDSTVTIRADGVLRSRQQGEKQLESALYRSLASHPQTVAYWPMEDGQDAAAFASPIVGVAPMFFSGDDIELAGDDVPGGTRELPSFGPGSTYIGRIPIVPGASNLWEVYKLFRTDETLSVDRTVLRVKLASELLDEVSIQFNDTEFKLEIVDNDGVVTSTNPALNPLFVGNWLRVRLDVDQVVTGTWRFRASAFLADTNEKIQDVPLEKDAGGQEGRLTRVEFVRSGSPTRRFGHITVINGRTGVVNRSPFEGGAVAGYSGELAADRFERLADEEGLSNRVITEPTPPSGGMALSRHSRDDFAVTPDHSTLDITGDIDIRMEFDIPQRINFETNAVVERDLARKYVTSLDQRSWLLDLRDDRTVRFWWSPDGVNALFVQSTSPIPDRRVAIRVTLDVDDGADNHVITFYTAFRIGGIFRPLGDPVTEAGTTSIFASTADVEIGRTFHIDSPGVGGNPPIGRFFAFELRNGTDGTEVANPDFTGQAVGTTAFTDDAGRSWTLEGEAAIVRPDTTTPMGPQRPEMLTTLFREIETADGGIRDGLTYRTRRGLYNQDPPLRLSIPDGDLPQAPKPTDDDQRLRNDVTVERVGGSSVRRLRPPGQHSESIRANLFTDELAARLAEHRLTLGIVDEYRFPKINIALHKQQHLIPDWLAVKAGDRLTVEHDTPQMPGVPIDLIIEGWSERIGHTTWDVELNCAPASPYEVAVFGQSRFDTEKATLASGFEAGVDTSMSVATEGLALWTTDAGDLPFDIAVSGVVLRVTAISGTASPQTFTVDQTPVNGVHKAIAPGEKVTLARRTRFGW